MNNFQRVWLASGVVFGIGISGLDAFLYDRNLIIIAITGLVSGIVSGLIFGFIAHLLFCPEEISCLRNVITASLLTVAGFIIGIGFFIVLEKLPHGQWQQIVSPPEKAVRFIGQSAFTFWGGSVYIESESGNIFSYTCDSVNPCNWAKEETPPSEPEENYWSCPPGYNRSYATPVILFNKVIDSYEVNICGVDYTNQINLIMLDDGTVWVWNRFMSANAILFCVPLWLIISSGAGFLGYIALLIRRKKSVLPSGINP